MTHPIRSAVVHTFERKSFSGVGRNWIAQFYPYNTYPVFFSGPTEEFVVGQAEAMRKEAIDKYEQTVIARQEAKVKSAKTRAKKKETAMTAAIQEQVQ
jgi:hypothetical protein